MGAQKDIVMKDVAKIQNKSIQDGEVDKAITYLKHSEIESREEELVLIDDQKKVGPWVGMTDEGRRTLVKRETAIKKELRLGRAPELEGDTKDALYTRLKNLETTIKDGMPPMEVMRRNPAGAVDWHMKWEKSNKNLILERKNILRALNPGNTDKDLTNVEMLRPVLGNSGDASVMVGAQIPGKFGYHNVSKENWDKTFGKQETKGALGEIERMEATILELKTQLATREASSDPEGPSVEQVIAKKAKVKQNRQNAAAAARTAKRDKVAAASEQG